MLCCVADLESCLLSCPGSSVGRALCLVSRVSCVRVPPRAAPFSLEKCVVLVGVPLFVSSSLILATKQRSSKFIIQYLSIGDHLVSLSLNFSGNDATPVLLGDLPYKKSGPLLSCFRTDLSLFFVHLLLPLGVLEDSCK